MNKRLFKNTPKTHPPTLRDIARKLKLSISVVSRALNPKPDANARVNPDTLRTIQQTARRLGFRPNRAAEFLKRGGAATIGVFLPARPNRLVADLVIGISEKAAELDFPLHLFFSSDRTQQDYRQFIQNTRDLAHSGIITYSFDVSLSSGSGKIMRDYQESGGKIILLNDSSAPSHLTGLYIDSHHGGALAARRLMEKGCRAFFTDGTYWRRSAGFLAELETAGIQGHLLLKEAADAIHSKKTTSLGGDYPIGMLEKGTLSRKISEYRKKCGDFPIGILASTDVIACGFLAELKHMGLTPGKDALLIGYDDQFMVEHLDPPLTTIHQPFREEGRRAVEKLVNLIYGKEEKTEVIQPHLVVRGTA